MLWFDARAALAEIAGDAAAAPAIFATRNPDADPASQKSQVSQGPGPRSHSVHVARVAGVARPSRPQPTPDAPALGDRLDADARAYLARLRLHGPATYGAMAATLGWGSTRTWQAEARLRARGLVRMDELGRAVPITEGDKS
ncbi:MAG: hypothetical protein ACK4TB_03435 [Gemmobacter sp.]